MRRLHRVDPVGSIGRCAAERWRRPILPNRVPSAAVRSDGNLAAWRRHRITGGDSLPKDSSSHRTRRFTTTRRERPPAEGKVYRDDIGQCWPAGLPLIMTRVWPIAMIQLPTSIHMISDFMNSLRIIYLDGRGLIPTRTHRASASTASRSDTGKETRWWSIPLLRPDHHWIDSGNSRQRCAAHRRTHAPDRRTRRRSIEYTIDRSEELGRRLEDDEALESCGRSADRRSVVPA